MIKCISMNNKNNSFLVRNANFLFDRPHLPIDKWIDGAEHWASLSKFRDLFNYDAEVAVVLHRFRCVIASFSLFIVSFLLYYCIAVLLYRCSLLVAPLSLYRSMVFVVSLLVASFSLFENHSLLAVSCSLFENEYIKWANKNWHNSNLVLKEMHK